MKVLAGGCLPAGAKLFRDGNEVGLITSSTVSPRLGAPLALGFIRRGHQDPGLRLGLNVRAGEITHPAVAAALGQVTAAAR